MSTFPRMQSLCAGTIASMCPRKIEDFLRVEDLVTALLSTDIDIIVKDNGTFKWLDNLVSCCNKCSHP